jgi:hypothetical protein
MMVTITMTWAHVATLISGFVLIMGAFAYHVERRFSDLRSEISHRFEDLYRYLDKVPR